MSSRTGHYGVAVGLVALATLLSVGVHPLWREDVPALLFYPAVVLSAWHGGLGPGVVASVLSALVISYYWLPPRYSFAVSNLSDLVGLAVFLAVGVLISVLNERRLRRATAVVAMLRKSEQRYRLLFQRNPVGMFRYRRDGALLDCNEALVRLLGYASREDALAHNVREFFTHDHDHGALIARLRPSRIVANEEVQWQRRDGSVVAVLLNVREDEDGSLEAIAFDAHPRRR
jgi:PAS domain S-box-containing protein